MEATNVVTKSKIWTILIPYMEKSPNVKFERRIP